MTRTLPARFLVRSAGLALLTAAALLAGCAAPYLMDNTVQSFSALADAPAQAGYRFERLPSQRQDPAQPRLEALADASLARAGLRRDDAAPRYSVEVWSRTQHAVSPWAAARYGWGGIAVHPHRSIGLGLGFPLGGLETPWYQRELGLVMRELPGGRVVYETHAFNDGFWIEPALAWAAMLDAALQGFPQPPAGVRRVDIQIRR